MTRAEAVRLIETARTPAELFGSAGPRAYRRLARLVHPDAGGPREAFDRLTALWHAHGPVTIRTRRGTYALAPAPVRRDLANLYDTGEAMVKIPRDPAVNDLLEREAIALRQLPWPCTSWRGTRPSTAWTSAGGAATCSSSVTSWPTRR